MSETNEQWINRNFPAKHLGLAVTLAKHAFDAGLSSAAKVEGAWLEGFTFEDWMHQPWET